VISKLFSTGNNGCSHWAGIQCLHGVFYGFAKFLERLKPTDDKGANCTESAVFLDRIPVVMPILS